MLKLTLQNRNIRGGRTFRSMVLWRSVNWSLSETGFGVCCSSDSADFGFRLWNQVFIANRLDESFSFSDVLSRSVVQSEKEKSIYKIHIGVCVRNHHHKFNWMFLWCGNQNDPKSDQLYCFDAALTPFIELFCELHSWPSTGKRPKRFGIVNFYLFNESQNLNWSFTLKN